MPEVTFSKDSYQYFSQRFLNRLLRKLFHITVIYPFIKEEQPDDELWDKLSPCQPPQMFTKEEKAEEDKNKDVIVRKGFLGVLCTPRKALTPSPKR